MGTERKVKFEDCLPPASDAEVEALELAVGFSLPVDVRWLFQNANGGCPNPCCSSFSDIATCLGLGDLHRPNDVWSVYTLFVAKKRLLPAGYLPFAVDSFGNYYVVDCRQDGGGVFAMNHEHGCGLEPLGSWDAFWGGLRDLPSPAPAVG